MVGDLPPSQLCNGSTRRQEAKLDRIRHLSGPCGKDTAASFHAT